MRVRWLGVAGALVLLAAGAALVGYRLGDDDLPAPVRFEAQPVPAASPSIPVTPAEVVLDDPYPALRPGVPTRPVKIGAPPFQVTLPVPRGWVRSDSSPAEWRWYPERGLTTNLFFFRVSQVGQNHQPVPDAVAGRVAALRAAPDADDLVVESQSPDRFVSTYVTDEHRRVSYEGFIPRDGAAYLRIAVIGREADRAGLADLFDRLMSDTQL
jgi:hypothetical protein